MTQAIGGNSQQRHQGFFTVVTVHNAAHSPVQCAHIIQAWTGSIHSTLVDPPKSH